MPNVPLPEARRVRLYRMIDDMNEVEVDRLVNVLTGQSGTPFPPRPSDEMRFNHEQWNELIEETIKQIGELSRIKGGEYAAEGDRLDNFRRNGADCGVPMEVCWRIYAGKHWDSITTYVRDIQAGRDRVRSEPIQGRADDLIVYLLLFKAMCRERGVK